MIYEAWAADGPRSRIAEQHGIAVSQRRLAAAARNEAEPSQIHVKAEIVVAIAAVPACVLVTDTLHSSRQEAEIGKLAEHKVDTTRKIRHRFERYPGQAAVVERLNGPTLRMHPDSVCGTRAHIASPIAL
jgi:hypothetical protein